MAKPRTAPPSAPKTVQDGKPADTLAVTEEKASSTPSVTGGTELEQGHGELAAAASGASAADGASVGQLQADHPAAVQDIGTAAAAAAAATSNSSDGEAPNTWCFEVLSPFKHNGVVVKPPAWIEMTWEEAEDYQDAGLLGDEPATPEELE